MQVVDKKAAKKADAEAAVLAKIATPPEPYRAMGERRHDGQVASALIDGRITELGDWRGMTLRRVRELIKQVDPEIVEEWKWRGTPVWSHNGGVCTGEAYKNVVKMTFFKGAFLEDSSGLFNSSLDGKVRRAIDIREGDRIDESGLKDLIRAAVKLNLTGKRKASG
jgi:hypothetical protein